MQNAYTVTQVNAYIKNMFMQDYLLHSIRVKGEVSNCKHHPSGHIYFTLKDNKATMPCVMFAGYRKGLLFKLEEGQQIIVEGAVDVYERDGRYQLYAKQISLDGAGELYERFERLKQELEERGMFDASYKQKIPDYCKTLGVVTAATGAAVRDIITVAKRRNPYIQIILYPATVQGEQAAPSIVNGIRALEKIGVDTIIVGRGGGSIEDLWAFNEEIVAQAIFDCSVPIISGVGHETDTTIADFVADLRAATPSAAAELAVSDVKALQVRMEEYSYRIHKLLGRRINGYRNRTEQYQTDLKYLNPVNRIRTKRTEVMKLEESIQSLMNSKLLEYRHCMSIYIEQMKGLSPLDKLSQGYSYTSDIDGNTISSIHQIEVGEQALIYLKDGILSTKITEKKDKISYGRKEQ